MITLLAKQKKPVTKQANSKELISYTVSYTKVYKLHNSRWERKNRLNGNYRKL